MELTQEYLKSILDYKPETGIFTWKVSLNFKKNQIGDVAGYTDNRRYVFIRINGKLYRAHRLAWLFSYGKFPEFEIDHINRIKNDNRLINLRELTHIENLCNSGSHKDSESKIKGISKSSKNRWRVRIMKNYISYKIGHFNSLKDAIIAYNQKAKELFGELAYLNNIDTIKD